MYKEFKKILSSLGKSKFRSSFKLIKKDIEYINRLGITKIELHARDFIIKRIAPTQLKNDGRQTPFKGHPVFKAQHATATCCRGCLSKWYNIPKGRSLGLNEVDFIQNLVMAWILNDKVYREGNRF